MTRVRAALMAVLLAALAALPWPPGPPAPKAPPAAAPAGGSKTRGVTRAQDDQPAAGNELSYRRRHALIVGVDHYGGAFGDLDGPGHDAAEVAAVLALRYGFEDVDLLLDHPPAAPAPAGVRPDCVPAVTRDVLAGRLRDLRGRVGPGDALLFYYAGHGARLGAHGFLVPAGADPDRPDSLLDLAAAAAALRACAAHHTLMVLDCCFSGTALEAGSGVPDAVGTLEDRALSRGGPDNLGRVFSRPAFQIITAGTGHEAVGDLVRASREYADLAKSLPEFQGHSPFTAVFLQALDGLTGRPDGKQLASDLGYYMTNTLVNDPRLEASQAPRYGAFGDGDFILFPSHKVLNPRLLAPLYLVGPEYAEPRQSACRALRQYILKQPEADREGLTRAAVPHLARLLGDPDGGARLEAARALASLAEDDAADVPEFGGAVGPLAALLRDDRQPAEVRSEAARALGRLGKHADQPAVRAFRDYVNGLDGAWKNYQAELAAQLNIGAIPSDGLRLPEELQAQTTEIRLPPPPVNGAPIPEQMAFEEARRRRLALLSAEALAPFVKQRHERGKAFLKQAEKLLEEGDSLGARMTAGQALGFQYAGRPEGDAAFAAAHPVLLFPDTPEWQEAERLVLDVRGRRMIWCSPVSMQMSDGVNAIAFAPQGGILASAGDPGTVCLWDLTTGRRTLALDEPGRCEKCLSFSPDGKALATGGYDGCVRLWDVPSGKRGALLPKQPGYGGPTGDGITALAFTPDGKTLVTGTEDYAVHLWDLAAHQPTQTYQGNGGVSGLAVSPDGKRIVCAALDGTIRLLDAATAKPIALLADKAPVSLFSGVAFSPDGRTVAAGDSAGVRLWDLVGGTQTVLPGAPGGYVGRLAFSPDGKTLAAAGGGSIRLWDAATGRPTGEFHDGAMISSLAFSPDGRKLAAGDWVHGAIRLWDLATKAPAAAAPGVSGKVTATALSADGKFLAAGTDANVLYLWDMAAAGTPALELRGHDGALTGVAFSPDGTALASGAADSTVRLWDPATGKQTAILRGHDKPVAAVAYSPDGKWLASAGDDGVVRLWDPVAKASVRAIRVADAGVAALAFSPDGAVLAGACTNGVVRSWNPATGMETATIRGPTVKLTSIAYCPDGKQLATAGADGSLRLWDAALGRQLFSLSGHFGSVDAVAFSPDGRTFASAGYDRWIRLWDASSGNLVGLIRGHTAEVRALAFAPDGGALASGGEDRTVRLWEVGGGRPAALPGRPAAFVAKRVSFSADGRGIAAGFPDSPERLWDTATGAPLALPSYPADSTARASSPDGRTLAAGRLYGVIELRDAASGAPVGRLRGHDGAVKALAFSPDGRTLASGGADHLIRLWSLAALAPLAILQGHETDIVSVAFSPDGRRLVSRERNGTVLLWGAAGGRQTGRIPVRDGGLTSLVFSPDGAMLAAGSVAGPVRVWDTAAGAQLFELPGPEKGPSAVEFLPDGRTLACQDGDHRLCLWDLAAGRRTDLRARGPSVAFSPDGATLAERRPDGAVRLWDLALERPFAELPGRSGDGGLAFSPDGKTLASADGDGLVRLHAAPPRADLTVYLPWCEFHDLELGWKIPISALYDSAKIAFQAAPGTVFGAMRRGKPGPDSDRALFLTLLRSGGVDGARVVLPRLAAGQAEGRRLLAAALRQAAADATDAGAPAVARRRLREARDLEPESPENAYLEARLAMPAAPQGTGPRPPEYDSALSLLEQAAQGGFRDWARLEGDPALAPLHGEARYAALLDALIPAGEWERRGRLAEAKDRASAFALYDKAITHEPNEAEHYAARSGAYERARDYEAALADLQTAIRLAPEDPASYLSIGRIHALRAAAAPAGPAGEAARGEAVDRALDALEQAVAHGYTNWGMIKFHVAFTPLRDQPRYRKLIEGH